VAIGGIKPDNCQILLDFGADFIAVINAVWNAEGGVEKAINDFTKNLR
jgi:thiamine-phosphate pyrophosphorylase